MPGRSTQKDDLFQQVRLAMVEATRQTFDYRRKERANETFYAFALYADNHADGLNPASQTEEAYQRRLAKNKTYKEGELGLLRYCPDEWDMNYCGSPKTVLESWRKVYGLLDPILEDETLDKKMKWEHVVRPAFETMIQTLADLDSEGFFGRGPDRELITLMIWITDSSLAEEWWAKSVRQLNSSDVYQRFIASGIPEDYRG